MLQLLFPVMFIHKHGDQTDHCTPWTANSVLSFVTVRSSEHDLSVCSAFMMLLYASLCTTYTFCVMLTLSLQDKVNKLSDIGKLLLYLKLPTGCFLHSLQTVWVTRIWICAVKDVFVTENQNEIVTSKYPGVGCRRSTMDFLLIEHLSRFTLFTCWSLYYLQTVSHHLENTSYLSASLPVWTHVSLSSIQILAFFQYKSPYRYY